MQILLLGVLLLLQGGTSTTIRSGDTLPPTCSVTKGNLFIKNGVGLYFCSATNVWTFVGGGGGGGVGTVTSVQTAAPITGGPFTDTGVISIPRSTAAVNGYLHQADFATFNNKQNTITVTSPIQISGSNISCPTCTTGGGGGGGSVTSVGTSAPLTGGPITNSGTISLAKSTGAVDGYLAATDFTVFNGKENALTFNGPLSRSVNTISVTKATGAVDGYLAAADFTTFNGKENSLTFQLPLSRAGNTISCATCGGTGGTGTVTSVATTAPLSGGTITTTGTLSIAKSTGAVDGYLAAADFTIFNGKENALTFTSPLSRASNTISCPTCVVTGPQPYDLVYTLVGLVPASTTLPWYSADRAVTLAANFAGSSCANIANATGSTVLTIKKNGSQVGTVTFGTSGACTYATSGGTTVTLSPTGNGGKPDFLTITTPAQDATLAGITFSLAGTR